MYALTIDEYFIAFDASERKWKTSSIRETRIIICLQREMNKESICKRDRETTF